MLRAILFLLALISTPSLVVAASRAADLAEYRNDRFGYSILYRHDYFDPDPPSATADGRVFRNPSGAELLVAAIPTDEPSLATAEAAAKVYFTGGRITYRRADKRWLVLSGYDEGGRIAYVLKAIYKAPPDAAEAGKTVIATLVFVYPPSERRVIDADIGPAVRYFLRSIAARG
jgi:hypothetical protein